MTTNQGRFSHFILAKMRIRRREGRIRGQENKRRFRLRLRQVARLKMQKFFGKVKRYDRPFDRRTNHSAASNNVMARKKMGASQISCSVNLEYEFLETVIASGRLPASLR